jgi:sugar lactone lactonase YvrE
MAENGSYATGLNDWRMLGSSHCGLGESPFWHPDELALYWVDAPGKQLLRAKFPYGATDAWDMPSEPGCIAPARNGGLVIALRHGIFRAATWGAALEHIATLPCDPTRVRANDGKCDALGRFWVGTLDETKTQQAGALYSIDCRGGACQIVLHADGATTANGLAWSPDNGTAYWADTPLHQVRAWDYNLGSNALSRERMYLNMEPKPPGWAPGDPGYRGRPDGAAVDTLGGYWTCLFEGQRLARYSPDGTLIQEIRIPAQCPTMPCFGGPDLKTLFVTSASKGRSAAERERFPDSGAVFYARGDVAGLPVNFFEEAKF